MTIEILIILAVVAALGFFAWRQMRPSGAEKADAATMEAAREESKAKVEAAAAQASERAATAEAQLRGWYADVIERMSAREKAMLDELKADPSALQKALADAARRHRRS